MVIIQVKSDNQILTVPAEIVGRGLKALFHIHSKDGPISCVLPSLKSFGGQFGFEILVSDDDKTSSEHNITIQTSEGDKINNKSEVVLKVNGAAARIFPVGLKDWKAAIL